MSLSRWQINVIILFVFLLGISVGLYFALFGLFPKVFATSQGAITYDTSTQFQSGTLSQTQVIGSGTPSDVQLEGNIGPGNTTYKIPITINNTGNSSTLTNYQVQVNINTASLISAGQMQSDCADIRFADSSGNLLPYWIEGGCNTTTTQIWVNVNTIAASSDTTINMYYGSASASSLSNGNTTFNYFDQGNNISSWAESGSAGETSSVGDSAPSYYANSSNGDYMYKNIGLTGNEILTFNINTTGLGDLFFLTNSSGAGQMFRLDGRSGNPSGFATTSSWTHWNAPTGVNLLGNTWYKFQIVVNSSGTDASLYYKQTTGDTPLVNGTLIGTYSITNNGSYIGLVGDALGGSYTTYLDNIIVSQYSTVIPTVTIGAGTLNLDSSGNWSSSSGSSVINTIWNGGWGDGSTSTSTAFSATVGGVTSNQTITFQMKSASSVSGLSSATYYTIGTASSGSTFSATMSQLNSLGVPADQYIQVNIEFAQSTGVSPTLSSFTIYYAQDNTPPSPNASAIVMSSTVSGGYNISSGGWDSSSGPYFSWTQGADSQSGMKGYCLYLGTDPSGDPATTEGLLGASPISTIGSTCQFIISSPYIDLSQPSYQGSSWLTSSNSSYYFSVSAIDNNNNVDTTPVTFSFYYDGSPPVNVSYISCAGGNFSNVSDMIFSWPTTGLNTSSDSYSGVLGWQYQMNSSTGQWLGSTTDSSLGGVSYIPSSDSSLNIPSSQSSNIIVGTNIIYFRTISNAGDISSPSTYRTCSIEYGGAAPTFPGGSSVTINPTSTTTNYFSLSWPTASAAQGKSVTNYYYMINTQPPQTLSTLQSNIGEYINNGSSTQVGANSFANVRRGVNTVYVVAIDNSTPPNYSPSNYISSTFDLNSTNPDPVGNLIATDSSIKAEQKWNVTLTWTAPVYQGAGNLQYLIYRSSNNIDFTQVGSTLGLSYVDNTPQSALYYYYVVVEDGAGAFSSNSYTVSIIPTGRYTTPPLLEGSPSISNLTDQSATISWSTNRNGDSKVQYGLSPSNFYQTLPSVSTQVTYHSITLSNLTPGTTYYYKALWTDSDGNTGISGEYAFTTSPPPEVSGVHAGNVSLYSGYITFSISNAVQATVEYGATISYGGEVSIATSPITSTYSVPLVNLSSGTAYNYRIIMQDSSGNLFYSDNYTDLVTLQAPQITNVRLAQVSDTVVPTVMVSWDSNTPISSIVSYWPINNTSQIQNKVDVKLQKGLHEVFLQGLSSKTGYNLIVKGVDSMGNQTASYTQTFTTATNTMPPLITGLNVQGEISQSSGNDQLVISWTTDTPSTSQVEFGIGAGSSYSQKTQESAHLVVDHLVVIPNLIASQVYHLKAISVDQYGNIGYSIDTVTITPSANQSAFNLVLSNLGQAFGFLGGI